MYLPSLIDSIEDTPSTTKWGSRATKDICIYNLWCIIKVLILSSSILRQSCFLVITDVSMYRVSLIFFLNVIRGRRYEIMKKNISNAGLVSSRIYASCALVIWLWSAWTSREWFQFVYARSQWETTLQCNVVSHRLSAYTNQPLDLNILPTNALYVKCWSM